MDNQPDNKRRKALRWQLPFLLFLIVATVLIIRHQRLMPYQLAKGPVFGTFFSVKYQHDDNLQPLILEELQRVDASLSAFNDTSVISRINTNKDMSTDERFEEVFKLAQQVAEQTDGCFDITVAPLVNAWGFGFKKGIDPTQQAIDSIMPFVGYGKVKLQGHRIVKEKPQTMLDASAIAKGFACDRVATVLRAHDVQNFVVEIGGEVVAQGKNEQGEPWRVGIAQPQDDSLAVDVPNMAVLSMDNCAMATSGNYRNFYYRDGKKYAHTINPHDGRPVQHSLLSATVVARNCATADAYATAFMVMGMEKAKLLLEKQTELSAFFIYADSTGEYDTWCSPKLEKKLMK